VVHSPLDGDVQPCARRCGLAAAAGRPAGAPSFNGGGPSFGRRDGFATDLAAAASYLGLTASELQTKLQRGSTLAQVAAATSGKTRAAVIAAIVEAEQQNAPSGVATRSTTELTRRVTALVSGTRPQRPPPGGGTPQGAPATTS